MNEPANATATFYLTNPIDNMQVNNLKIIAITAAGFLIGKLIIIFFL